MTRSLQISRRQREKGIVELGHQNLLSQENRVEKKIEYKVSSHYV